MVASKRISTTFDLSWLHHLSSISIILALVFGLSRSILSDQSDPQHCHALLNRGRWLDYEFANWQPDGCMSYTYEPVDVATCLSSKQVVFIGDAVARQLFFQFVNVVDPKLLEPTPNDGNNHQNYALKSDTGVNLSFYWDPFMNSSYTQFIHAQGNDRNTSSSNRPALLVIGTGLWYLRYANASGGLPAWESRVESVLDIIKHANPALADSVVFLPVEEPASWKLSPERPSSINPSDVDAMNSDLYHRVYPLVQYPYSLFRSPNHMPSPALPLAFNRMLDPPQTEDGLHFFKTVVRAQANLLLNLRCNNVLPMQLSFDKTCCRNNPWPSLVHMIVVAVLILWGPLMWLYSWWQGRNTPAVLIKEEQKPSLIISGAIALIYVADRTDFWQKEQKQFSPWTFAFLTLITLALGLVFTKKADRDLGFLNREQTDEWQGWMQIAILIYHYTSASKVSGISNPVRVLFSTFLFMSGYVHTIYYVKKADFGFLRVAQVMIRLNLLTVLLAYAMNTNYLLYYFAPLLSIWYLIIYVTMAAGSRYNDRTGFVVFKIVASMAVITWFMSDRWLLETLFEILETTCAIRWSAQESLFLFKIDLWIVYFGMLTALAFMKVREYRLTDHVLWPVSTKVAIWAAGFAMVWYFWFELSQPTSTYNGWHPFISFIPIASFFTLRNANQTMRSSSSRLFAFIGGCSLETFIIQYHLWMAADNRGLLIVIPWTRWRSLNMILTTTIFIHVSYQVSEATAYITSGITKNTGTLPTHGVANRTPSGDDERREGEGERRQEVIPLVTVDSAGIDEGGNGSRVDTERPSRPRWIDRLANRSSTDCVEEAWRQSVLGKVFLGLGVMWLLNMIWPGG